MASKVEQSSGHFKHAVIDKQTLQCVGNISYFGLYPNIMFMCPSRFLYSCKSCPSGLIEMFDFIYRVFESFEDNAA